jgi:hypothetical protein
MKEQWKYIEGYDKDYEISSHGRVKSNKRGKTIYMALNPDGRGYLCVTLSMNGDSKYWRVHKLVSNHFIPNPDNKKTINHIDGNKKNNHVDNLEWASYAENIQHAFKNGLNKAHYGESHGRTPFTENDVLDIRNAYRLGCFSQQDIADAYGVSDVAINNILNRKSWRHI